MRNQPLVQQELAHLRLCPTPWHKRQPLSGLSHPENAETLNRYEQEKW
jgi:hypothetical protein